MRLPLTLSIACHAIVFALLVLLVAEPPPPQPAVKGGIEVVLGQSSSQPQAVLAPEAVSQPADPSTVAAVPPQEVAEPEPVNRGNRAAPYPGAGDPAARPNRGAAATAAQARCQAAGETSRAPAAAASNCHCADPGTEPARRSGADRDRGVPISGGAIGSGRRDARNSPGTRPRRELRRNDQRLVREP
jgi:hypothetical protein